MQQFLQRVTLVCALVIGFSFAGNFASALPITYNVNQTIGLSTVTGNIQTDGTIGVLLFSNITDWTLTVNFNSGAVVSTLLGPLSGNNSRVSVVFAFPAANAFSATASQLLFDFDDPFFSRVVFFNDDVPFPFTAVHFLSAEGSNIGGLAQTEYMPTCCTDLFSTESEFRGRRKLPQSPVPSLALAYPDCC